MYIFVDIYHVYLPSRCYVYMFAEFTRHVPMVTPGHYVTISDQLEVPASNRRCYRIYMDIHI